MIGLSRRQQQILDYIRDCIGSDGLPPSRAEISRHFGFASPNAAQCHLKALEAKGVVRITPGTARGIVPLSLSRVRVRILTLPLIGQVAAGRPILAIENTERELTIDPEIFRPRPDYLLRVRGESMIEAGIADGDLVAIHQTGTAESGQIVVARVDDEVTVKRLRKRGRGLVLEPANPEFQPVRIRSDSDFALEGLVVGVIRKIG